MNQKNHILNLGYKIRATYDENDIIVYQAYNNTIANAAIKNNRFSDGFSFTRMSWIKPSFLWMMYRSNWAQSEGQNRILSIHLKREAFDSFVNEAVLSIYSNQLYSSKEAWQKLLAEKEVRCQWDPERDIAGNPIGQLRTIQIGLKGKMLELYNDNIIFIRDITERVHELERGAKIELFRNYLNEIDYK